LDLTHERLLEVLHYDPETGIFTWLVDRAIAVRKGKIASKRSIKIDGAYYRTGRLAFFYMMNKWPIPTVDHIDRNKQNHRWNNLREASRSLQVLNRNPSKRNINGSTGVYYIEKRKNKKWRVKLRVQGKSVYRKSFATKEEAIEARKLVEMKWLSTLK